MWRMAVPGRRSIAARVCWARTMRMKHANALDAAVGQVFVKVVVLASWVVRSFDVLDDERRRPLVGIAHR